MKKLLLLTILFLSQMVFSQSDCISAIPVCGNSDISYNPSSSGTVQEATSGSCLADEHYSVWYVFTAATTGTIEFTITPNTVPGVTHYDYDFAVYGPNINCATWDFGNAIKCNFSGTSGPTGLSSTITGSQWETPLNVTAGETYYLLIDNYIPSNPYGFSLTWGGTASLTSAFNNPALTPNPFITPGTPAANPADPNEILKCALPSMFDFSTLSTGIINGNPNFSVTYHLTSNDAITGTAPITTPIMVNATTIYYYRLKYVDPNNPTNPINGCFQVGKFKFRSGNIVVNNATITSCNYDNTGIGYFDLNSANVYGPTNVVKKYYPTMADLTAGTNEITTPSAYASQAPKTVFVKITTNEGCTANAEITLQFLPALAVVPTTVKACNNNNAGTGVFDLTAPDVYPTSTNVTKKYYPTLADLNAGTNAIANPSAYLYNQVSGSSTIYVKVSVPGFCSNLVQIQLSLKKTPIFDIPTLYFCPEGSLSSYSVNITNYTIVSYQWTNPAGQTISTTNTITGINTVGTYSLTVTADNGCSYTKTFEIKHYEVPVITSIQFNGNNVIIYATGSKSILYSIDGINWQVSNSFNNLPTGITTFYVRFADSDCIVKKDGLVLDITNAITPNGDGLNDHWVIKDLQVFGTKMSNLKIFDRYQMLIFEQNSNTQFYWDGMIKGRVLPTASYWYVITIPDGRTFTGWVVVKNHN